ncbi:MFS transporter [Cohaesibacter haloalkalitolerans]|uniref:MFS transporter n=1 Tax=Cohaesibacter haloalkalitolerans TaxID=1162980 RepID=UPI000E64AB00
MPQMPRQDQASTRKPALLAFFQSPDGSLNSRRIVLFLAFFALALNMRGPITSLPPVIAQMQRDLGISQSVAGLLSSIPVLCFGLATPLVSLVQARVTIEQTIAITLWGVLLGTLLRSFGDIALVMAGTVILGVSMTFGNIVALMVVARDFNQIRTLMTGILVSAMSVGSMLTSAFTAPLASLFGWHFGLGIWAIMALLGIVLWTISGRMSPQQETKAPEASGVSAPSEARGQPAEAVGQRSLFRRPSAWLMAAAFGTHTFMFYGLTAWLPVYLTSTIGASANTAGFAESMFQIMGLTGCFGIPWMASRFKGSHMALFLAVTIAWFIMAVGTYLAPSLWPVWAVFGGFGSGGGYVVIFDLVMSRAATLDEGRKMSTFVQGLGYVVASISPTVVGSLHQWTASWTLSFVLFALSAMIMAICGIITSLRPPVGSRS